MPVKRSKLKPKKKANEKTAKFYFDESWRERIKIKEFSKIVKEFSKIEYSPGEFTSSRIWDVEAMKEILKTEEPKDPVEAWAENWMKKNE